MTRRNHNLAVKNLTEKRTSAKSTPADMQLTEELFRSFTENIEQIVWMTDVANGKLLYINPAYERIFGLPLESAYQESNSFLQVVHPEDIAEVRLYLQQRITGERTEQIYRIVREDNSIRWIWARAYPVFNDTNELYRMVGIVQDITERKMLEEELLHTKKMQAIGELAGGIAHDFNNLLTPILGYSSVLARGGLTELRTTRIGAVMQQAAIRAAELTQQLLAFARKGKQRNIPVDVHSTLESVIGLCERTFEKKVEILRDFADQSFAVQGDPGQMHQVFLNLAINARDAVSSTAHDSQIQFSTAKSLGPDGQSGDWVCITVQDNGVGMDEPTRARAFEPFFTTKDIGQGTGLGLATVYGIVSNHGGTIVIETVPGHGCAFKITLPLTNARPEISPAKPKIIAPKSSATVLLIDDDCYVCELVEDLLTTLGCRVKSFSDPLAAVEYFRAHAEEIDFVLLDVLMPTMNGSECLAELRQIDPNVGVIISSGCSFEDTYQHLRDDKSILALLQKPYTIEQLSKILSKVGTKGP